MLMDTVPFAHVCPLLMSLSVSLYLCTHRRLELYPLGNVRKDSKWANCVSVYLALSTAPPADGIECKYGLRVRNPRGGKDVELVSTQKFTNENMSWGRPSLLTANEVEQYIDANGYCTVEVNVGKVN